MAKLMRYYVKEVRPKMLAGCPDGWEVHHMRGKLQTLLIDKRFLMPVSRLVHNTIRDHPEWARMGGFLCAKGQWNHAPNDAETKRLRELIAEITK